MRISVLTVGSRGDVQPYIALCNGLRAAGHEVRLATCRPFRETIEASGLEFSPFDADPREIMRGSEGRKWLDSGESSMRFAYRMVSLFRQELVPRLEEARAACEGADAVIHSPLGFAGWHVAEALGIPSVVAGLQPGTRTRAFPATPAAVRRSPGGIYNLLTWVLVEQVAWQPLRSIINRWRRESLGIPAVPFSGPFRLMLERRTPVMYGFSPLVVPKPRDWPEWHRLTGYWFLDGPSDWQPPARVTEFLDAGPPPVYVGFGSMMPRDPAATIDLVLCALRQAGVRGILATGWMAPTAHDLPDDVLALEEIPHDWLFPRVAAVVHHGGAGTTASAIRAGTPAIVVPFFADQPFWAKRVAALGVGPPPIPERKLTAERLAAAIKAAITDEGIRRRSVELGERLRAEDGVGTAVEIVERVLQRRARVTA